MLVRIIVQSVIMVLAVVVVGFLLSKVFSREKDDKEA